jgi:hypothetical protein
MLTGPMVVYRHQPIMTILIPSNLNSGLLQKALDSSTKGLMPLTNLKNVNSSLYDSTRTEFGATVYKLEHNSYMAATSAKLVKQDLIILQLSIRSLKLTS